MTWSNLLVRLPGGLTAHQLGGRKRLSKCCAKDLIVGDDKSCATAERF